MCGAYAVGNEITKLNCDYRKYCVLFIDQVRIVILQDCQVN